MHPISKIIPVNHALKDTHSITTSAPIIMLGVLKSIKIMEHANNVNKVMS